MKPRTAAKSETVFKVFLFTDIVGSTDLKRRLGNEASAQIISQHDELFRHCLSEFGGIENDHAGDGFFATFDRPSGAVHCALAFQQRLAHLDIPEKLRVRTGIHMGEIVRLQEGGTGEGQDKLIGIAIDTAARIMGLSIGGQVLLTRIAFDIAREQVLVAPDGKPIEWRAHGPYMFKGIDTPLDVYEVGITDFSPLTPPPDSEKVKRAVTVGDEVTLGWRPAKGHPIPNRPNWELVDKLGEGSFGEVWLANHKKVKDRHVFKFCFQPDRLRGLKREVVLFRLLQESLGHREDIAQIIDWQFEEPPYFLESEYTEGGDLGDWCKQQGGAAKIPMETRLDLIAQLAEALAAAHSVGVLHKDIKPSNVLILNNANTGRPQIRLTDFGIGLITDRQLLAQRGITSTGLTMTGLTMQTQSETPDSSESGASMYVAPEVIEGKPATTQSDIYGLGIILYQIVVGNFRAALAPGWERDVEDEFLREDIAACVDGKPSRRLGSATELAQRLRTVDIRRREREAQLREAEASERAKLNAEKSKGRRLIALVVVFTVVSVTTYIWWRVAMDRKQVVLERDMQEKIAAAATQAEARAKEFEHELYIANVQFAASCVKEGRLQLAHDSLLKAPESLRNWEWGHVLRRVHPEIYQLEGHTAALTDGQFSPDGSKALLASADGTASLWDVATGARIAQFKGHTAKVNFARFSADGVRVLTGSDDRTGRIWEAATGRLIYPLNGHSESLLDGEFSPDASLVVTASSDVPAKVWNAASGAKLLDLSGHEKSVRSAHFSRDGQKIVTASEDGTAKTWDAKTGKLLQTFKADRAVLQARFSADGARVIGASIDGMARIWDAATAKELAKLVGHQDRVRDASFSPDGAKALTASDDGSAKLWDAKSGKEQATLKGHEMAVTAARFASDAAKIVTVSEDRSAAIWDAASGAMLLRIQRHEGPVVSAELAPNQGLALTASEDGSAKLWDATAGSDPLTLAGHEKGVASACYDAKGARIVTGSPDQTVRLWDAATGAQIGAPRSIGSPVRHARFSPDGLRILVSSDDPAAEILDAQSDAKVCSLEGHSAAALDAQYSADGKRIVTASADKLAKVWDAEACTPIFDLVGHADAVNSACFSPDGKSILTVSSDKTAKLWDAESRLALKTLAAHTGAVMQGAFSPDGKRIVTAAADKTARVWSSETGAELVSLVGHSGAALGAAFSPDGRRILTTSADRTAKVWDAQMGRELATIWGHADAVLDARFSPDGKSVVTASRDKTAKIWDAILWDELKGLVSAEAPFDQRLRAWQEADRARRAAPPAASN